MMRVKDLLAILQKEDPQRVVILLSDAEGNCPSPLSRTWTGAYRAETAWMGKVGLDELTDTDLKKGYTEDDVIEDGVPALILVPVC